MKLFVGLMAVGVVLGLCATKSVLYAGEPERVKASELRAQAEEAKWQEQVAQWDAELEAAELQAQIAEKQAKIEYEEIQARVEREMAVADWRYDFFDVLEADEPYAAAKAAVDAYRGDDEAEFATLESARDGLYYDLARSDYERRFGPWQGSDDEFSAFLVKEPKSTIIRVCFKNAKDTCGEGKVKSVTVTADGACIVKCGTPTVVGQ